MSATQAARELGLSESGLRGARKKNAFNGWDSDTDPGHDPSEGFTEIPVFVRDYSHLDSLRVYPLSDVHVGSKAHARDRWTEWLSYLEGQSDVAMILNGDLMNAALKDSKSESYEEQMTVGQAKRQLAKDLDPIRAKIDLAVRGNHEARAYRATGDCPVEDLADRLDVPYTASAALLVYKVGQVEYEMYVRHGVGNAGGMLGSRANSLAKVASVVMADIYLSGHVHSQLVARDEIFLRDGERMVRKRRLYVSSGSFLNYEEYAKERGYVPGAIGAPRIYLDGRKKDAHASI